MARHTTTYVVTDEGRDKGKHFLITEMSASKAESWAMRALMALMGSNVDLPEGFETLGMAGLAQVGFKGLSQLSWNVAEPLLAEMLECVQVIPDRHKPSVVRPILDEDYDIEEITTRLKLRMEVWSLHTDFLKAVAPSLVEKAKAAGKQSRTATSVK